MNAPMTPPPRPAGKMRTLWRVFRTARTPATRLFALAELVCFPVSLLTLVLMAGTAVARFVAPELLPVWWTRYALPLLATGAVGYLTNYVAVRMLFEPYRPSAHWLTLMTLGLWRRGLIPARREELAERVGQEIAGRLLTPRAVAEEVSQVVAATLDDPDFRAKMRATLAPVVARRLPEVLGGSLSGLVGPLLARPETRDRLTDAFVGTMQEQAEAVTAMMRVAAEKYLARSPMGAFVSGFAGELINWKDVTATVREQFGAAENRPKFEEVVARLSATLAGRLDAPEGVGEALASALSGDALWDWAEREGLDAVKPALLAWLSEHGEAVIGAKFDVAGRARKAIEAMDVAVVHEMVDAVAAEQLGAIQVLGFVLGLAAGVPLVLLM